MMIEDLHKISDAERAEAQKYEHHVHVCMETACIASRSDQVKQALTEAAERAGKPCRVKGVGCMGLCSAGPLVKVEPDGTMYKGVTPEDADEIVQKLGDSPVGRLECDTNVPFFQRQVKIVLENSGEIDPERIEDYVARDGYLALYTALTTMTPSEVIAQVAKSGLRGRGGAGFSTGLKWTTVAKSPGDRKFVICNADEGDPGAFMDRSVLEGDPHSVIEGMIIAAYAIGASQGYIYCRAEYPLAVQTLNIGIKQARALGLLGKNILGSNFSFDLEVRMGAGAFVCGEETALMASIEGKRGEPRPRPPFPAIQGLWGKPTNINNVETYANVPQIILRGAEWFASMGTEKSKGTKTFAIAGDVNHTGLIEVPLGITLREVIFDVGGGIKNDKRFKAVQTGGPMGGCLPAEYLNMQVDYESLTAAGSIMGSGGMIVMDEDTCMVDIARFFMEFTQDESCGKCTPCRVGTKRILEILERICAGHGKDGDIETLEMLCRQIKSTSLCGLGQGAPNPVESTLKHFRAEYEAHIYEKRCPASVCKALVRAPCVNTCPAGVDSPAYLALVAQGRYAEGLAIHRETNPFALICGRVCPAFCETKCRRGQLDQPVSIRLVKRFMADRFYAETWTPERLVPPNGKRIAVVGAGPTGLTAALDLTQQGYTVTVFDKMAQPGGMMTYGIPNYRLPREPLFAEINHIRRAGVEIRCGQELGRDFTLDSLKEDGYAATILALGAHKSQRLAIPGEDKVGVYHGVKFLRDIAMNRSPSVDGQRVVIVGGGDVAIDSARSAWRLGAAEVHVVYRREERDMPAHREEIEAAKEEGVQFHFLTNPMAVLGMATVTGIRLQRQTLGEFDSSGRRRPKLIARSEFDLACDIIIPAIGQVTDFDWMQDNSIETNRASTFKVGLALETTVPGVFAAGDAVLGPASVIHAVAQGHTVALAVEAWVKTGKLERVVYKPK
ncbi:MAG: NADH-quinone oxidoreductase subunit NuoF, partial [Chloroflexi bacterium]|nr:NADH-quinone oxidoreductase subunit NuoF [Chloroflexota bacterium]